MSKTKEVWGLKIKVHVISLPRVLANNSYPFQSPVRWNLYLSHALIACSGVQRHVLRMLKLSFIKSSITLFLREVEWTKDKNWCHHIEVFYGCRGGGGLGPNLIFFYFIRCLAFSCLLSHFGVWWHYHTVYENKSKVQSNSTSTINQISFAYEKNLCPNI